MIEQAISEPDVLQEEYNVVPYQSFPFHHTHPTHLYTLAKLFGLNPRPIEDARILELGCAGGGNLIPLAYHFPKAYCLGIDLAEKQIDTGLKQIADLNLKNITLRHQSILDFNDQDGKFDYIICHGVYSWVDAPVRDKILALCRENLSKNGIAYVSYNTFPGWNMVNSIRDLMRWHTRPFSDPLQKAQQARSILKFLGDGLQQDNSAYAQVLHNEINLLSKQADNYLLHDHLSTYNEPCYFYEFMEHANKHQLAYLSDAFLYTMYTDNFSPAFANELKKIKDIVVAGQYMDFIRNQRFRSTLLCSKDQPINRALKTGDIEQFYLQFNGKCSKEDFSLDDVSKGLELQFTNGAMTLNVHNPISQLAMFVLIQAQKPILYTELCKKIAALKPEVSIEAIKNHFNNELNLMRLAFAGFVTINSYPGNYITTISDKPVACPFVRYQAQNQNWVTNRRHQTVPLDPVAKILIQHLDGKNDIAQLSELVWENIQNGKLSVLDGNKQPMKDLEKIKNHSRAICEMTLKNLAKQAVLIK